jgi:hypothetical protein
VARSHADDAKREGYQRVVNEWRADDALAARGARVQAADRSSVWASTTSQ